jgi:Tol biopolymer transport system component
LFVRERNLMAQRFDAGRLELTGEPFPVAENVETGGNRNTAAFSVSENGVLVYTHVFADVTRLVWLDRQGKEIEQVPAGENGLGVQLSPDDRMAATFKTAQDHSSAIWVLDLVRGTASRLTFEPVSPMLPVWSPDGKRVAYSRQLGRDFPILWRDAAGVGNPEPLLQSETPKRVQDWSRDGRWVIYGQREVTGLVSIWALPTAGEHKPVPVVPPDQFQFGAALSPDGHFLAYGSSDDTRGVAYVRTFSPGSPSAGGKWQVSTGDVATPSNIRWRRDGKELFYVAEGKLMAVPVRTDGGFQAGKPVPLFDLPGGRFAVRADGQRFLAVLPARGQMPEPIQVVLNWTAGLRK